MDDLLLDDQRVVGPVGRIRELIRETKADCLFVASSAVTPEDVVQIMKARRMENVEVRFTANLPTVLSSRLAPQTIGGVMTLSVNVLQLTRAQAVAKRACDLLISGLGLLVLLPLFAVVAAAIKLTSPGPVVFRQERVGLRGRPFTLLKFRTMVVGADLLLDTLRERNEADGPLFKLRQDPRVTRVGDLLRRYSIDELPQLWNVLKGEMSLVGPRPLVAEDDLRIHGWDRRRLHLTPGMTGPWQVLGSARIPLQDMVKVDYLYVATWSLWGDVKILLHTLGFVVRRQGI
jgi:exopolysaccharide biosynthesis polyprenyl glycosylphosphotransferase